MLPEQEPFLTEPIGARCARHPALQAIHICSRCGSYTCTQCSQLASDGKALCVDCMVRVPVRASRSARFVANLVDQFVVLLPIVAGALTQVAIDGANPGTEPDFVLVGLGALVSLCVGIYQLHLVARSGQTIGKRMAKIRMLRTDGSPVSVARVVFLRNLVPGVINSFCGFFNLVDSLFIFGNEKRCLHDYIADTQVVEASEGEGDFGA